MIILFHVRLDKSPFFSNGWLVDENAFIAAKWVEGGFSEFRRIVASSVSVSESELLIYHYDGDV
jgi:hypothetical protein